MALRLLARHRQRGGGSVFAALSSRQRAFAKPATGKEDKEQDNKVQQLLKVWFCFCLCTSGPTELMFCP